MAATPDPPKKPAPKPAAAPAAKKPVKLTDLADLYVVWDADLQAVTDIATDEDSAAQARVDRLIHRDPSAGELYLATLSFAETDEQKTARAEASA